MTTPPAPGARPDPALRALAHPTGRIAALAWPLMIGQLAVIANSVIDTAMVSRYSSTDLAALALGVAIYISVFVGLSGVLQSLSPVVGQLIGAGRHREIGAQLRQGIWLSAFLTVAGGMVLLFPQPLLEFARASPELTEKVTLYLRILVLALPATLLFRLYGSLNLAMGRPKMVMAIQVAALALKIPLNALFIFGGLGLPAFGGPGCAIATAIAAWLSLATAFILLRKLPAYRVFSLFGEGGEPVAGETRTGHPERDGAGHSDGKLAAAAKAGETAGREIIGERGGHDEGRDSPPIVSQARPTGWRIDWRSQRELLKLGVPMGLSYLIEITAFSFMAIFIARLGETAVGGHQITANLGTVLYMLPLSIANATAILVAQAIGAGDHPLARHIGFAGIRLAMGVSLLAGILVWVFRSAIIGAYTPDPAVAAAAMPLFIFIGFYQLFDSMQVTTAFVLRAYKVAIVPTVIYAVSLWGIGLGGGYLTGFDKLGVTPARLQGASGFWIANSVSLGIVGVGLLFYLRRVQRQAGTRVFPG